MDLQHYQLKDFLNDPSFQNWVFQQNPQDVAFWDTWIKNHPGKKEMMMDAAQIIRGFEIKEKKFSDIEVHNFWLELEEKLQAPARRETPHILPAHSLSSRRAFLRMAASFAGFLLLAAGAGWFISQPDATTHTTAYGETTTITLPDSSQVTLNGNSELHYLAGWEGGSAREVWLKGEAFFEVEKIANTDQNAGFVKFVVHTSSLDIEVVGTSFNVNDRHNETTVVLEEGKVKLQREWGEEVVMQPGEMVAAFKEDKKLDKKVVNPSDYSAWRYNKLIFDDAVMAEVVRKMEDNYGLKIVVARPEMLENRFTGSAPADRPDILYKAVAASFGWEAQQEGKIIYFNNP